jgi:hypothetical protein
MTTKRYLDSLGISNVAPDSRFGARPGYSLRAGDRVVERVDLDVFDAGDVEIVGHHVSDAGDPCVVVREVRR